MATIELFSDSSCSTSVSRPVLVPPNEITVHIITNTITSDGRITYYAHQTDQAGNESECSILFLSYEYDGTKPLAPLSLSLRDPLTSPSNDPKPEITISGVEPLAKVELFSDSACSTSASSQETVLLNQSTVDIIANTLASGGTVIYYALQTDQAGNESLCSSASASASASLSYDYEGTKPPAPSGLSLHDPLTSPSNEPTPEIIVAGVEPLAIVELFSDSACSTSASSQVSVLPNEITVNIIANALIVSGIVTYYARQTDPLENESPCSQVSLSYDYNDETKPLAPSGLSLHNPLTSPSNNPTPEIIVAGVEPLSTVELFSDSSCSTSASSQVSAIPNESTVNIIATSISSDSTVTYYARQTDQARNDSSCSSASLSYEYDGTKPLAPSGLSLHIPSTSPNNNPKPKIVIFGVEPLSTVELFSDSNCSTSVSYSWGPDPGRITVNITANTLPSYGTFTYYAHQTDGSGNVSDCSSSSLVYQYTPTDITGCSDVEPAPNGYSNLRPDTIAYSVSSTSFYRMDINGLNAEAQQFEFCLSPYLKVTADLNRSYVTENNSLVWEGEVAGTQASFAHQLANSIIFVKRNSELMGTVWVNGYVYRVWPLSGGLYQIEKLAGPSILDQPHTTDLPMPAELNTDEHIPEISVMTVFTSEADEEVRDIYALSDLAIAETNFAYRASRIRARLKSVHVVAHDYVEGQINATTNLVRMISPDDGHMDNVHVLRDQYEAISAC